MSFEFDDNSARKARPDHQCETDSVKKIMRFIIGKIILQTTFHKRHYIFLQSDFAGVFELFMRRNYKKKYVKREEKTPYPEIRPGPVSVIQVMNRI